MDETIHISSNVGQRLYKIKKTDSRAIVFQGKKIPLVSAIKLGRSRSNDVVIDDKMVSRFHCVIQKIKEDYYIKDLNSANGTFVNTMRVPNNKYIKLQKGDIIRLGKTELTII
jgi:pSer/pThr/pTyr-binding forkhead associated (FHA) protein